MGNEQKQMQVQSQLTYSELMQLRAMEPSVYMAKMSSPPRGQLLRKVYSFNESSEDIMNYLRKLASYGQYIHSDNLLLPVCCYVDDGGHMCDQQKKLEIYLQSYHINIKDQIVARKRQYERFMEAEVWYLLYSMLNGCRKFQLFHVKSGPLKTNHVLLNESGFVKVINQLTEPEYKDHFLRNFHCTDEAIIAPEELKMMRENRLERPNENVSQTFSIGIILLEICTFIDGDSFYDMQRNRLNQTNLQRAEEVMRRSKYSKLLQNLIRIMLSSCLDRPLPSQIYSAFKPYEKEILMLEPFRFDISKMYGSLHNSDASFGSIR